MTIWHVTSLAIGVGGLVLGIWLGFHAFTLPPTKQTDLQVLVGLLVPASVVLIAFTFLSIVLGGSNAE